MNENASLIITRLIPGHEEVTVEWSPGESHATGLDLCYEVAVKLREAPWDSAFTVRVPAGRTKATVRGLTNHADYALRVRAYQLGSNAPCGISVERLFTPAWVPGVVIDYLHKDDPAFSISGQYIGSPSIAKLDDGTFVASHDIFGRGTQDLTRIFRSEDAGLTWRHIADIRPAFWGKLFTHRDHLYLLACASEYANLVIYRSTDGGATWTGPVVIAAGHYHKAPVPVITHRGRLWTCVELQTGSWPRGFQAVWVSVPEDADFLDPANWTVSEPLAYDPAWLPGGWALPDDGQGYLEGNAVVDPQGRLLNILRWHVYPYYGKAVVLAVAQDGTHLTFEKVIDFPGGMSKFTIHWHPQTRLYWSLVNRVTKPNAAAMRSVLSLVSSPDLNRWTVVRDILRDDREPAVQYTGFQYADWLFDGPDIVAVVRTAFNGAHNYHDANYLTFHRISDFAKDVGLSRQ